MADAKAVVIPGSTSPALPTRPCGRCRAQFPTEPGQDVLTLHDWWLCGPCHEALMGR